VPAGTFGVSANFALANFLASRSFGMVAFAKFPFPRGSSNETYHVPWDLVAMSLARAMLAAHRRALRLRPALRARFSRRPMFRTEF
jgi:hypothetical protein